MNNRFRAAQLITGLHEIGFHNRHNLHTPRPARALIEKYRHEKQQRPTFRWR